jgi:hypothetical protein
MNRAKASLPIIALGVAATMLLASCGGSGAKLLPGTTAREITANLDTVKQLTDEGDCVGAESAAQQVGEQIQTLGGVDPRLKRALEEGTARLNEVVASCEETITETVAPTTVPTEPEPAPEKPKKEPKEKKSEEEQEEVLPPEKEAPPLPPQANGKAKGHEPTGEEEEGPVSGGVSPSAPVGEGN